MHTEVTTRLIKHILCSIFVKDQSNLYPTFLRYKQCPQVQFDNIVEVLKVRIIIPRAGDQSTLLEMLCHCANHYTT